MHHTLGNIHPVHKKRRTSTKSAHSVAPSLPNVSETSAHVSSLVKLDSLHLFVK